MNLSSLFYHNISLNGAIKVENRIYINIYFLQSKNIPHPFCIKLSVQSSEVQKVYSEV